MSKYDWDGFCNGQTYTLYWGHASEPETVLDMDPRSFGTILGRMARRRGKEAEYELLGSSDRVTGIRFRCVEKSPQRAP